MRLNLPGNPAPDDFHGYRRTRGAKVPPAPPAPSTKTTKRDRKRTKMEDEENTWQLHSRAGGGTRF
jgi:hypothetical protein